MDCPSFDIHAVGLCLGRPHVTRAIVNLEHAQESDPAVLFWCLRWLDWVNVALQGAGQNEVVALHKTVRPAFLGRRNLEAGMPKLLRSTIGTAQMAQAVCSGSDVLSPTNGSTSAGTCERGWNFKCLFPHLISTSVKF